MYGKKNMYIYMCVYMCMEKNVCIKKKMYQTKNICIEQENRARSVMVPGGLRIQCICMKKNPCIYICVHVYGKNTCIKNKMYQTQKKHKKKHKK